MAESVSYKVVDGIAILSVSNPPGNALSVSMRRGLIDGLDRALADDGVAAVLVMGKGRSFPVGVDISELSQPPQEPTLSNVCDRFEASRKPVIAVLHGMVLGGGFEIALAAHYRVAAVDACIGLPEVTFGILPGAGGTQRAPRLAGAELALELMLSGKLMQASDPRAAVFCDALIEGDLKEGAIAFAQELVDQGAGPRPTRTVESGFEDPKVYQRSISAARSKLTRTREAAPREIVNCVEAAALLPFDQGAAFERAAFDTLVSSDQSVALRHAFVAENRAATFPQSKGARLRDVAQVGIVGGGTMGRGIAMACLAAGLEVTLVERDMTALETAMNRVDLTLDRAVKRAQLKASERDRQRAALIGASDLVALSNADLVIEAVPEDMDIKLAVFSQLDGVIKDGAILASSTSYLDVNQMGRATGAPGDVLGLHFFPPAASPRVVEVIVAEETSPDATATSVAFVKRLGKIPVQSRVSDGYIGNRVQSACCLAADLMLEAGATPYLIDEAMENWGMARGPYKVQDLNGLDQPWVRRTPLATSRDPHEGHVAIGDRLCDAGRFGQKSGRGYYLYSDGNPKGVQDPEVIALIRAERERKGITARGFKPEEIQRRCLAAMANEGARLISEGVAIRPSDIDTVMIHGFGFPRWRGGPMMAADLTGLLAIQRDLHLFALEEPGFWAPDAIFAELIKTGRGFESLNG